MTANGHLAKLRLFQKQAIETHNPITKARIAERAVAECVPLLADLVDRVEFLEFAAGGRPTVTRLAYTYGKTDAEALADDHEKGS